MSGTSVEHSCSKALANNSPNKSQLQAVSSLLQWSGVQNAKPRKKGTHRLSLATGWAWSLPDSTWGAQVFFLGHSIWIMVQLLNRIELQMRRTSSFHGKVVIALSDCVTSSQESLSLAGLSRAPQCYFFSAGQWCGLTSYKRYCFML